MHLKCSVPSCNSKYGLRRESHLTIFKFPRDEELKSKWLRNIPHKNWQPSKNSAVCVKHFHEDHVIFEDVCRDKDGILTTLKRQRPILKENAVPQIFPGLPKYLSVHKKPFERHDPSV